MSWIGLSDQTIAVFDPEGVSARSPAPNSAANFTLPEDGILPIGTLLIEALFTARPRMPQRILRHENREGWHRRLSIILTADGDLTLECQQGDALAQAHLSMNTPASESRLRISYSWNAPGRHATLTVENLDEELLFQAEFTNSIPLPIKDVQDIILNGPATRIDRDTRVIAVSDKIEPVGLASGVVRGTPVETLEGPKFIERLRLGDKVITANGEAKPVRWIVKREVPALGRFRPVRLRAPYFGLTRDIFAAQDHRIMVTGAEAEYLFNESTVLVQAQHLTNGKSVREQSSEPATLWYYHVLLDGHECLKYAGLWGESLFVGAIGRSPEMIATTSLGEMSSLAIPRHTRFAQPILSSFEARTLALSRSA